MTSPSIPDFIAGYGPQQSDMQSLWVNPATFFQNKIVFRATQTSGATSLPDSGAFTKIAYNNIIEDPYSGWSSSTHQWTAPVGYSGFYLITVSVWIAAPGALDVSVQAIAGQGNGTSGTVVAEAPVPDSVSGVTGACYAFLEGGQDTAYGMGAIINSSSAVSTSVTAGENSTLEIMWIMAG